MTSYKVGPGKPPLETRFKPGNKEWQKREKKRQAAKAFNADLDMLAVLGSSVPVKKNGEIVKEVRLQVTIDSLVADALRGDVGAANALMTFRLDAEPLGDLQKTVIIFDEPGDADC